MRKFSGPLDYLYIDFETSLKSISEKFENYLSDIVVYNRYEKKIELHYKKNTTKINDKFYKLLDNKNICYMADNYNYYFLLFNQNYINESELSENLYDWTSLCIFHHHNILDNNIYNLINARIQRFNTIYDKYNETTCLFFISKIINNCKDYIDNLIEIKKKYNINCAIIFIINCDNIEKDNHFYDYINNCLFIIKKVDNYHTQFYNTRTDNNLNYENEYNIMLTYFDFQLVEKDKL